MPARKVLEGVWLVGSGTDEQAFTNRHDSHCYLVWDGASGFLVDAGTGRGAERWLAQVAEVCDPARLAGVLITHYHLDHAGGAAAARDAGLTVWGHRVTATALGAGDEERTQVRRARDAGVYPPDYRLTPAAVDVVEHGPLPVAPGLDLRVHDAPGHCDGHLVASVSVGGAAVLFSGDCLFAGGEVSIQPIPDCRVDVYGATVRGLAALRPDALLPGHGDLLLDGAAAVVDRAAGAFGRLVPPPNLIAPW